MGPRKPEILPDILILPGPDEAAAEAAARITTAIRRAADQGRPFNLALSGGSTPRRLFKLLAAEPYASSVHWDQTHFFWGDERCVPPEDEDSNYRMARVELLDAIGIPEPNVHRMRGENTDPESAAREYEAVIRNHFDSAPDRTPSFDLVLLGMGDDGHTASLFPGTTALRETRRWVAAPYVPMLKAHRLTLTPVILNRAGWILFLVTGAEKADTLAEVLQGPFEPDRLPAQLIRPGPGNVTWMVDEAAAKNLKGLRP